MLTSIWNVCLYFVIDVPGDAFRAGKKLARDWWYSRYR